MPYKRLFSHVTYEAADLLDHGQEYVCDLADIPVPDGSFDLVFCSQTLEHVTDPVRVLKELRRVLKPGGEAWMTAPFSYEEHLKPFDYFRYSQFAWQHMASEAGLRVEELDWLEGYYAALSYQLQVAYKALPNSMRWWRFILLHLARAGPRGADQRQAQARAVQELPRAATEPGPRHLTASAAGSPSRRCRQPAAPPTSAGSMPA